MTTLRQLIVAGLTGSPLTKGQDKETLNGKRPAEGPRIVWNEGDGYVMVKWENYYFTEREEDALKAGYKDAR